VWLGFAGSRLHGQDHHHHHHHHHRVSSPLTRSLSSLIASPRVSIACGGVREGGRVSSQAGAAAGLPRGPSSPPVGARNHHATIHSHAESLSWGTGRMRRWCRPAAEWMDGVRHRRGVGGSGGGVVPPPPPPPHPQSVSSAPLCRLTRIPPPMPQVLTTVASIAALGLSNPTHTAGGSAQVDRGWVRCAARTALVGAPASAPLHKPHPHPHLRPRPRPPPSPPSAPLTHECSHHHGRVHGLLVDQPER